MQGLGQVVLAINVMKSQTMLVLEIPLLVMRKDNVRDVCLQIC